jgi:hypothetical protein
MLVDHPDDITQFWWLDDDSMIVVTENKAVLRAYRDGTTKALDPKGDSVGLVMAHGDGKIFAKVDGSLRELDPEGGPPRVDLGPVKHAQRVPGALLYSVDNKTLVIAVDGAPVETIDNVSIDARIVVANLKAQRLAAYSDNDVVEYERVDGVWRERGRWIVDAQHLAYRNKLLIAVEAAGVAYLMPGRPPFREAAAISRDRSVIPGAVVVADEGVFVVGDTAIHALDGGPAEIASFTDRQTSFVKAGPYLVTMARTGLLRSWDLRRFYPRHLSMKFGSVVAEVSTDRVWFGESHHLVVYDLASQKLERLIGELVKFDSSALACDGPAVSILKLDEHRRDHLGQPAQAAMRTRDGTITPIAGDYQFTACAHPWLALKRTSSIEVRDARTPDREGRVFEAAGALEGFRVNEAWLAMIDKARTVTLVELATGRVRPTFSIGAVVGFALDTRGRVATTTKDGSVAIWVDGKPRTVIEKLDIAALHGHRVGFLVFTHDLSVVVIDHDARVVRYDVG